MVRATAGAGESVTTPKEERSLFGKLAALARDVVPKELAAWPVRVSAGVASAIIMLVIGVVFAVVFRDDIESWTKSHLTQARAAQHHEEENYGRIR